MLRTAAFFGSVGLTLGLYESADGRGFGRGPRSVRFRRALGRVDEVNDDGSNSPSRRAQRAIPAHRPFRGSARQAEM